MMTASRPMHGDNWTMMSCGLRTELQCSELSSFVVRAVRSADGDCDNCRPGET